MDADPTKAVGIDTASQHVAEDIVAARWKIKQNSPKKSVSNDSCLKPFATCEHIAKNKQQFKTPGMCD